MCIDAPMNESCSFALQYASAMCIDAPIDESCRRWFYARKALVNACCSVLQCVAVCNSVLQCAAVCGSVWQCVVVCCSVL